MTPRELMYVVETHNWQLEQQFERDVTVAWLNAGWHRTKKMPRLDQVIKKKKTNKQQSPEQMLAMIQQLNASMGGKTTYEEVK